MAAYCDHSRTRGGPICGVPDGVALTSADREEGLLLRSVSSSLPEHLGGRMRTREKRAISIYRAQTASCSSLFIGGLKR